MPIFNLAAGLGRVAAAVEVWSIFAGLSSFKRASTMTLGISNLFVNLVVVALSLLANFPRSNLLKTGDDNSAISKAYFYFGFIACGKWLSVEDYMMSRLM